MAREAGLTSPGLVSLICRTHAAREKAHKNLADLLNEKVPINVKEKSRNSKNLNLNVWTARIQPPDFLNREEEDGIYRPILKPTPNLCESTLGAKTFEMDNPEYFLTSQSQSINLSNGKSFHQRRSQSEVRKPSLLSDLSSTKSVIYANLGLKECMKRTTSTEIAGKVSKFEHLAIENRLNGKGNNNFSKSLWYFRDGLRSPTTPSQDQCFFDFGKEADSKFSQSMTQMNQLQHPAVQTSSLNGSKNPTHLRGEKTQQNHENLKKHKADFQHVKVKLSTSPVPLPMPPAVIVTIPASFTLGSRILPKASKLSSVTTRKNKNNKEKSQRSGNLISRLIPSVQARKVRQVNEKNLSAELSNFSNASPKLFQKSEKTVNIPAELVLGPNRTSPNQSLAISSGRNSPSNKSCSSTPISVQEASTPTEKLNLNNKSENVEHLNQMIEDSKFSKNKNLINVQEFGSTKYESVLPNGINVPSSPNSQVSPSGSLLTPNRIKTNGSLSREARLGSRSPQLPTSKLKQRMDLDTAKHSPSSPNDSVFENDYVNILEGRKSQMNKFMTIEPGCIQGGGEDLYSSEKTNKDFSEENHHSDTLVMSNQRKPPPVPSKSPKNVHYFTMPGPQRKPPKSKHDKETFAGKTVAQNTLHHFPSSEASHRMLIGTMMLQNGGFPTSKSVSNLSQNKPKSVFNFQSSDLDHFKLLGSKSNVTQSQQNCQILNVWTLKKELLDLESMLTEDMKQLELEHSLLTAECNAEKDLIRKIQLKLSDVQLKEARLSGIFEECQKVERAKTEIAKSLLDQAEIELQRLEFEHSKFLSFESEIFNNDPDGFVREDSKFLEKIRNQHDLVEATRKRHEDIEFQQIEDAFLKETEKEELGKEIFDLKKQLTQHCNTLKELEKQQKFILLSAKSETTVFNKQRESILEQFKQEKTNIPKINQITKSDLKLRPFKSNSFDALYKSLENVLDEDSDTSSEKDDQNFKRNHVLEASLSKLALLEKELSVFEDSLVNKRTSSNFQNDNKKSFNKLQESTGISEDERDSKIDSISQKNWLSMDGSTGSFGQSCNETSLSMMSLSDDVSLRKKENFQKLQQRPLTRYLPIRDDCFDLRHHIETAGHQIDLCTHIELDAFSCKGFLYKMSGPKSRHLRTWKKRYFVFDRKEKVLSYFQEKSSTKHKGFSYFEEIQDVYVDHLNTMKSPHPTMTFCIKTVNKVYFLISPTPESMRIWVDVIFTGAEGYRGF